MQNGLDCLQPNNGQPPPPPSQQPPQWQPQPPHHQHAFTASPFTYTPFHAYNYGYNPNVPQAYHAAPSYPESHIAPGGQPAYAYQPNLPPPFAPPCPPQPPQHVAAQETYVDDTGSGEDGETEIGDEDAFELVKPAKKGKRGATRGSASRRKNAGGSKKTASSSAAPHSRPASASASNASSSTASGAPAAPGRGRPRARVSVISLPTAIGADIPAEPDEFDPGMPFRPDPDRPPIQLRDYRPQLLPAPPGAELDIASLLICIYGGRAIPGADLPTGGASASGAGGETYTCRACAKSYGGKNARSVARRHLQDKHGFPLALQPRRSRWDSAAHKPMDPEDAKEKALRAKREWACKNRSRAKAARQAAWTAQAGSASGQAGPQSSAQFASQQGFGYDGFAHDEPSFEEFSAIVFGPDGGQAGVPFSYVPNRSVEELEAAERALAQQDREEEQGQGLSNDQPQAPTSSSEPAQTVPASDRLLPPEIMTDMEELSPEIPPAPKPTMQEWAASWQPPMVQPIDHQPLIPVTTVHDDVHEESPDVETETTTPTRISTPVVNDGHPQEAEIAAESLLDLHSTPLRSSPPDGIQARQAIRPSLQHRLSFGSPKSDSGKTPKRQPLLSGPAFVPRAKPMRTSSSMLVGHRAADSPSRTTLTNRSRTGLNRSVSHAYGSMPTLGMPSADDPFSEPTIPTAKGGEAAVPNSFASPMGSFREPLRAISANEPDIRNAVTRKYASAQKPLHAGFLRYAEGSHSFASSTLASSPAKLSSPFKSPFRPSSSALLASPFRSGSRVPGSAATVTETPYSARKGDGTAYYPSSALKSSALRSRRNSGADERPEEHRIGIFSSPAGRDTAFALGFGSDTYRAPDTPWADVVRASTPRTGSRSTTAVKRRLSICEDGTADPHKRSRDAADCSSEDEDDMLDFVTPAKEAKKRFRVPALSGSPMGTAKRAQTPLRTSVLGH